MVVKDVYCTPHSHWISPSFLSIHCRRQHTTASVIHHNYSALRFTPSAVVLHEETVGDPVEVYSDYKKSSNRGFALCCAVLCGGALTHSAPEEVCAACISNYALSASANWTLIKRRRTVCG